MNKIIKNIDDVKLVISKYEWLKNRAIELLDYYGDIEILSIEHSDNDLEISYMTEECCRGENFTEYHDDVVPIEWLFLDDEELKRAKKEKKEAEEEARRKQEELNEMFRKKAQEHKDREEYERLKKKFEGEL